MAIDLRIFPSGHIDTNAFLVTDEQRRESLLIDAPHFVWKQVEPALRELGSSLVALLLTHGHYDHMGDAGRIQEMGVKSYAHRADQRLFETPEVMRPFAYPPDLELAPVTIDQWVEDGDELELLGQRVEVRHVPGHCPGNVLFYFGSQQRAFVGDALFAGSIGRTDLHGGDMEQLVCSIRDRIYTLPEDTEVLPGHGPTTMVGVEMRTNPYVPSVSRELR